MSNSIPYESVSGSGDQVLAEIGTTSAVRYYNRHVRPRRAAARAAKAAAWSRPVTEIELAWAAGLFEGEGTASILKGGRQNNFRPIVSISSTDPQIIQFFCERWPASSICHRIPGKNAKLVYTWRVASAIRVHRFLEQVGPFIRTARVSAKVILVTAFCAKQLASEYNREGDKSWKEPFVREIRLLNHRGLPTGERVIDRVTGPNGLLRLGSE